MSSSRFSRFSLTVTSPPQAVPASTSDATIAGHKLDIGILGQINARYLVTEMLFLIPPPSSSTLASLHSPLVRTALAHTLSSFPTLAGRIVTSSTGHLSILNNNAGAVYLEADVTGLALADIAPPTQPQSGGSLSSSWTYDDFPPSLYPSSHVDRDEWSATLLVQVTRVKDDGSTILGVWMDHAVHDAASYTAFMHALAATVRAMQQSKPPTVPAITAPPPFDASSIDRLAASSASYDHSADYLRLPPLDKQHMPPPPPASRSTFLHFSAAQLTALKAVASDALSLLPADARPSYISTQDALIAHLWSVLNEARAVAPSNRPLHFLQAMTLRGRTEPPIPAHYFGDAHVAYPCQVAGEDACMDDVRSAQRLARRAAAVRTRMQQVGTVQYVSSLLAAYKTVEVRRVGWAVQAQDPRHLLASSWGSELAEVDFGMGKLRGVYYRLPSELGNALILLPSTDERGGRDVWSSQTVEAYERMVHINRVYDFAYY